MLSHHQARAVYDHLGAKQDHQAFYEAPAFAALLQQGNWEGASHVFEFGCGTGSFALTLLNEHLSPDALYYGMDQSTTMAQLAALRLARFGGRAVVLLSDGMVNILAADRSLDRVVANYVLDLLAEADIQRFVDEAKRVLRPNGLLCLTSLAYGDTALARGVMWGWQQVYKFQPARVGGCRPIRLTDYLDPSQWRLCYIEVITTWGLASEVVVAAPH